MYDTRTSEYIRRRSRQGMERIHSHDTRTSEYIHFLSDEWENAVDSHDTRTSEYIPNHKKYSFVSANSHDTRTSEYILPKITKKVLSTTRMTHAPANIFNRRKNNYVELSLA